jgi:RNA polymerase sigma-70 factor (ECF subfamily)
MNWPTSDDDLMADVRAGSSDALGELYCRLSQRAYRVARAACRDADFAEEAVQEAFVSIWRSRMTYQPRRGPVDTWVLTVARNRAIDLLRRDGKHADHRAAHDWTDTRPSSDDVAAQAAGRVDAARLRALVGKLPHTQREVIGLAFYGQLTHDEIARRLALPPGTVKGRMRLGLSKLRDEIQREQTT